MKIKLKLEINKKFVEDKNVDNFAARGLLVTPPLNGEYWKYRVKLDNG
jgi:hypothetical protein